jgi:hypothetical protein
MVIRLTEVSPSLELEGLPHYSFLSGDKVFVCLNADLLIANIIPK